MASQKSEKQPTKEDVVSELITALQSGKYNSVRCILEGKGHNFAVQDILNCAEESYYGPTRALIETCRKILGSCCKSEEEESLSIVKLLLAHGADPNFSDEDGHAIHLAVKNGHLTLLTLPLEGNAPVNQIDMFGKSAMHRCCYMWNDELKLEIMTTLIKYKADVNLQDEDGYTPMHCSCDNGDPTVTEVLLENGASTTLQDNEGNSPLHLAVRRGDLISAEKILEYSKASMNLTNHYGMSALHLCISSQWNDENYFDISVMLIKCGADANLHDKNGYTPMHLSCNAKRPDMTTALLKNGALATTQDNEGNSPLHVAVRSGDLTSVRKILDEGQASVNQTNNDGRSALHLSCDGLCPREHSIDILVTLIQCNADVNLQDNDGWAPMHLSGKNDRANETTKLLENGALATIQDNRGDTPLHLAVLSGSLTLVRKLLEEGQASVNQTNNDGQSALHLCCNYTRFPTHHIEILTTLINKEADVNLQDKNGKTPLHLSCETYANHLATILVQKGALITIRDNTGKCQLHIAIENDDKRYNGWENSLTLRILHLVDSRLTEANENIELIIEAYEVIGLSASCSDLIGYMSKATQLREEHNIKKKILEPMECYGFAKEWETIEELEACRCDEKQLKLQATLARERIYQCKTEMIVELINDHLVSDVLQPSKSVAGKLLEHHLDIWTAQKSDSHRHNFLKVVRAWKNMIDEHFELFNTRTVVRFVRVTIENMSFGDRCIYSDFFVPLLSSTIVLIMKLYQRNWQLEGMLRNEQILAHELLSELMVLDSHDKPLQHWITDLNFRIPQAGRDVFSRTPYDRDLMKMLLESGIKTNEIDSYGNTVLHCALQSIKCDLEYPMSDCRFSQEYVDRVVNSITLMLEKGVYPNAQIEQYLTGSHAIGTVIGERINDILQQYKEQYAMTLKHKAAAVVKESGLPYEDSLPEELVNFVNLQEDLPVHFYEDEYDELDFEDDDFGNFGYP